MGQRLLEINVQLIIGILGGFRRSDGSTVTVRLGKASLQIPKQTQYYHVSKDPIPDDARVLSVRYSPYRSETVEVLLESKSWPDADPGTRVEPHISAISVPPSEEDVVRAADRLYQNFAEFGVVTDGEFMDELEKALRHCPGTRTHALADKSKDPED